MTDHAVNFDVVTKLVLSAVCRFLAWFAKCWYFIAASRKAALVCVVDLVSEPVRGAVCRFIARLSKYWLFLATWI